jgi:hypothetical protein
MKWINSLKGALHGEAHRRYKSKEAKRLFADSLLKTADKLFFAPIVLILSFTFLQVSNALFSLQVFFIFSMFIGSAWLRHEALLIIDEIET